MTKDLSLKGPKKPRVEGMHLASAMWTGDVDPAGLQTYPFPSKSAQGDRIPRLDASRDEYAEPGIQTQNWRSSGSAIFQYELIHFFSVDQHAIFYPRDNGLKFHPPPAIEAYFSASTSSLTRQYSREGMLRFVFLYLDAHPRHRPYLDHLWMTSRALNPDGRRLRRIHTFDETFDFVAVGSGGGSMCASLVMRSAGKSAVILEKTDLVGGTTARAGGVMWIPNNPFMRRDGIEDSGEQALAYLDAVIGDAKDAPGATPARRRSYVTEAPRMVEFLLSQGVKLTRASYWPDYYDELPGGSVPGRTVVAELFDANELGAWKSKLRPNVLPLPGMLEDIMKLQTIKVSWKTKLLAAKIGLRAVGAKLTGRHWVTAGAALQGRMLQAVLKHGIDIRTQSPVRELIVEDGIVTGVLTVRDGRPWRVGAHLGVLVNAGGFSHNQAMRDKYQPGSQTKWSMADAPGSGRDDRGDGAPRRRDRANGGVRGISTYHPPWIGEQRHQTARAIHDCETACDSRRPERCQIPERGRLLHGLLQGHVRAPQERARGAELGHSR